MSGGVGLLVDADSAGYASVDGDFETAGVEGGVGREGLVGGEGEGGPGEDEDGGVGGAGDFAAGVAVAEDLLFFSIRKGGVIWC